MLILDLPQADLDHMLNLTSDWEVLRGQRMLLTQDTCFIGKWFLGIFLHANRTRPTVFLTTRLKPSFFIQ